MLTPHEIATLTRDTLPIVFDKAECLACLLALPRRLLPPPGPERIVAMTIAYGLVKEGLMRWPDGGPVEDVSAELMRALGRGVRRREAYRLNWIVSARRLALAALCPLASPARERFPTAGGKGAPAPRCSPA